MVNRLGKFAVIAIVILFSFGVLLISIFRTAAVKYSFSTNITNKTDISIMEKNSTLEGYYINYTLVHPGPVLPDNPFWVVKALRDRVWLILTTDELKKAELHLLFADKRLASAKILFEKGKCDIGYSTLTKSKNYLHEAVKHRDAVKGGSADILEFDIRLANAALKYRQMIAQIILIAPEDAKPRMVLIDDYLRELYKNQSVILREKGIEPPTDPFEKL